MSSSKQDECENPIPTVDTIIDDNSKVLFIKRNKEPFIGKMVFPGGFMKKGETAEDAAKREVKEETSLDIELDNILGVYSDPNRDPRGHIMSTVFIGTLIPNSNIKEPVPGDGVASTKWISLDDFDQEDFGFDHKKILKDYKVWKQSKQTHWSSKN
jgi:ADP-ribose pyrophosphatase YjhB (NUDIX family)